MDKRFFLALVLTAIVIVATPLLFPGAGRGRSSVTADSLHVANQTDSAAATPGAGVALAAGAASGTSGGHIASTASAAVVGEITTVHAVRSTYRFSSLEGAPTMVVLDSYATRQAKGANARVELVGPGGALVRYRLALGADTVPLSGAGLQRDSTGCTARTPGVPAAVCFRGVAAGHPVALTYDFVPDSFIVRVRASVENAPPGSALLVQLPRTLASNERDTVEDLNHLAVSFRPARGGDVESVGFSKLDSTEARAQAGPLSWIATRNKYFLVAFRAAPKQPFTGLALHGGRHDGKMVREMTAVGVLPLAVTGGNGTAAFDIYAGPQDFVRLQRLGADLDQVNPYGGWLRTVVQPFTSIVMGALLWMKRTTQLNYGWVLILFGILIRVAMWPLQQGAMRTSMKMQRLQPELQALQKKHGDDPKRQQEAIMKVYKEHGMSPLSPLMGCLPMLLPMPVLFALYQVFQNTIEFRGVSFLWLPDISLRDPYFITPLLMGASMFVMSWIGLKGSPPNPQAKMMSYMMPVVLTVVFLNFASGLNLYYAVQNLAAIPQQWLLARERAKAPPLLAVASGAAPAVKRRT